jgi:hypothetical protein
MARVLVEPEHQDQHDADREDRQPHRVVGHSALLAKLTTKIAVSTPKVIVFISAAPVRRAGR